MMFNINKLIIRPAELKDVDFIATTIIEAEKSGTDKIGPANYFEVSETDYRKYLIQMLEEEIDGCEISLSSFVVAEYEGQVVAARGGWLEGDNEDQMSSSMLKSNLFAFILPKENLMKGQKKYEIVKDIMIEREIGAFQFEYSYTKPDFRGFHIKAKLDDYHINEAKHKGAKKIQTHVSISNTMSLITLERCGFKIVKKFISNNPLVENYYPSNTMVLLEMYL